MFDKALLRGQGRTSRCFSERRPRCSPISTRLGCQGGGIHTTAYPGGERRRGSIESFHPISSSTSWKLPCAISGGDIIYENDDRGNLDPCPAIQSLLSGTIVFRPIACLEEVNLREVEADTSQTGTRCRRRHNVPRPI